MLRPRKPFQSWRNRTENDLPKHLDDGDREMPAEMRKELARLGLL